MILLVFRSAITDAQSPDFSRDILPILYIHCTPCHLHNTVAPFSFLDKKSLTRNVPNIKYVITHGYMPPWKADTAYRRFANENILSAAEQAKLIAWIENGAVIDYKGAVRKVNLPATDLDTPDLIIQMPQPFAIRGDNKDKVVQFILPISIPADTDVALVKFVPGNETILHHCNPIIYAVPDSGTYNLKYATYLEPALESEKPFTHFQMKELLYYGGWLPGSSPMTFPDSVGFRLPKNSLLALIMHYAPSPKEAVDQSSIYIYFAPKVVTKQLYFDNIGTLGGLAEPFPPLVIPADSVKDFEVRYRAETDMLLYNCQPHMHLIGETFKAYIVTTRNDTIPLVKITDWDFRWQEFYQFDRPIQIQKGDEFVIEASYNNTTRNTRNPNSPTKIITQGPLTSQEMLCLTISYSRHESSLDKSLER